MTAHPLTAATAASRHEPLRWGIHALIGLAIGLVSPFTALAWPFALVVGMVIGSSDARTARGERESFPTLLAGAVVSAAAVIGMLVFGAIVGAIVAVPVAVLAAFSERAARFAAPIDRGAARILVFVIPILMWLIVFPLLGVNVAISLGG